MQPGTRLGAYELLSPIGAGGMGEVYRARDSRIGRDVAVKVLPAMFASDREHLRRFEQEARSAGSLNHPNLVTIYELGSHDTQSYIAMELLEGQTLRQKIGEPGEGSGSRIPLRKAIEYAVQIANGLAAAHDKGIVHRDLKPENVFVTNDGRVKILDFGLAKQTAPVFEDQQTDMITTPGTLIGTVSYMSPEQLRGEAVDHRSDIFAAGVILFEMVRGRRPFQHRTPIETMNAILKEEPAESSDSSRVPTAVDRVILRCLEKDREQRFQDARDLAFALQAVDGSTISLSRLPAETPRRLNRAAVSALGAIALGAAAFLIGRSMRPAAVASPLSEVRQVTFQSGSESGPALSPDGHTVAYFSSADGDDDIYVQRVGGRNALNLTADSAAPDRSPTFSPDGNTIAFTSMRDGGGVYVMGATGESVRRLTTVGAHPAWSPDGREIVYCTEEINSPSGRSHISELWIVDVATGRTRKLYDGDAVQPSWSPDGKHIVFWSVNGGAERDLFTIQVEGGKIRRLTQDVALDFRPVWAADGRSIYFLSDRGGTINLWQIDFPKGTPRPATLPAAAVGWFSLAGDTITYSAVSETMSVERTTADPTTLEPRGERQPVLGGTMLLRSFGVSPDGKQIAFTTEGRQEDVFVMNADGSSVRQLTNDAPRDRGVSWSPDGRRLTFYSNRTGNYEIWWVRVDGGGLEKLTSIGTANNWHPYWSPDGKTLAVSDPKGSLLVKPGTKLPPQRLPDPPKGIFWATSWSPDGRLIAGNIDQPDSDGGLAIYSVADRTYRLLGDDLLDAEWLDDNRHLVCLSVSRGTLVRYDTVTGELQPLPYKPNTRIRDRMFAVSGSSVYTATLRTEGDVWAARLALR